jgi:viologen exporter family transport system permease protein
VADRSSPYLALLRAQARSQSAYRTSFAIDVMASMWSTVADVVAVLVLFGVTATVGGFTRPEALVMVGLAAFSFAFADLLVGSVDLRRYVRTGLLDGVLVRPLPTLPQLVMMDLPLRKLSRAGLGGAVLVAALWYGPVEWTPARWILAVLAPMAGAVFFIAIFVAGSTVAFWWVESGEIASSVTYGGRDLTTYPMTVYSGLFRLIFGFGLGFAFVAYYPALALMDRPDPLGAPGWVGWCSPAVALPAAGAAALFWRIGIRHYRSTGS